MAEKVKAPVAVKAPVPQAINISLGGSSMEEINNQIQNLQVKQANQNKRLRLIAVKGLGRNVLRQKAAEAAESRMVSYVDTNRQKTAEAAESRMVNYFDTNSVGIKDRITSLEETDRDTGGMGGPVFNKLPASAERAFVSARVGLGNITKGPRPSLAVSFLGSPDTQRGRDFDLDHLVTGWTPSPQARQKTPRSAPATKGEKSRVKKKVGKGKGVFGKTCWFLA